MRSPVRAATAGVKCAVLCVSSQSGWLCMAESTTGTSAAWRMSGRARMTSCASGRGTRAPDDIGKRATRKQRPIAEKESQKWLTSVEAALAARRACPQTRFVSVGDREADVYDVLAVERPAGVDLLIRAAWDRCVTHAERYVWATVAAQPVEATATIQVPRRGAQPPRTAPLAVRWCPLTLCPPRHRQRERLRPVPLWAVQAREEAPPAGMRMKR